MLETLIHKIYQFDPDLLVAHNLCGSTIEVLLARIQFLRISHWSRIGRLKRSSMPTRKADNLANSWIPRMVSCGRLLVDTFLNSKELIRETNYDLGNLAKTQLKQERKEFDEDMLPRFYQNYNYLEQLANHTESDAFLTY
jgi:DNA polymerase alpha subunit A